MSTEKLKQKGNKQISTEILHKEIDLIQDIIKRMANNSFLVKGWMITLFMGAMVLLKEQILTQTALFVSPSIIFAVVAFWYIDAFFLHKERCYRALYHSIITNKNMSNRQIYSLDYRPFEKSEESIIRIMRNSTIWPFYIIPIVLNITAIIFVIMATK